MPFRNLAIALSLAVLLPACQVAEHDGDELLEVSSDAIVNGAFDTTHQAVVAWHMGNGKCSATIIAIEPATNTGYALSAAHCVSGILGELRQGDNTAVGQSDRVYPVQQTVVHPYYRQSESFDLAIVRFSGATASTPFIPAMPPELDRVAVGNQLEAVGYGRIEGQASTNRRRHKSLTVDTSSSIVFNLNQPSGGICFGDSGGPGLFVVNNETYVASVHSAVSDESCSDRSSTTRVSGTYDVFIEPALEGKTTFLQQSCETCADGHMTRGRCTNVVQGCIDGSNPACQAYIDCAGNCRSTGCVAECGQNNPAGKDAYDGIDACVCNNACPAECAGEARCNEPAACLLPSSHDECQSCYEQACCGLATACAVDGLCGLCVGPESIPSCDENQAFNELATCLEQSCPQECSTLLARRGPTGEPGSEGNGGGDGAGGNNPGSNNNTADEDSEDGATITRTSCGCMTPGAATPPAWGAWLLIGAGMLFRQRRKRRSML